MDNFIDLGIVTPEEGTLVNPRHIVGLLPLGDAGTRIYVCCKPSEWESSLPVDEILARLKQASPEAE